VLMTFRIAHTPARAVTIVVAARKTGAVSTVIVPNGSAALATPTSTSTARKATATRFLNIRNHLLSLSSESLCKNPGDQKTADQTRTTHQELMNRQILESHRRVALISTTPRLLKLSFTSARHRLKSPGRHRISKITHPNRRHAGASPIHQPGFT